MVKCVECGHYNTDRIVNGITLPCHMGRVSEGDVNYDDPTTEFECGYDTPLKEVKSINLDVDITLKDMAVLSVETVEALGDESYDEPVIDFREQLETHLLDCCEYRVDALWNEGLNDGGMYEYLHTLNVVNTNELWKTGDMIKKKVIFTLSVREVRNTKRGD